METTELYNLIREHKPATLNKALDLISGMSQEEIRMRHSTDNSTFLHQLVDISPEVGKWDAGLSALVPIVYRLAVRGINMNGQNTAGNTCLHTACIRPTAHALCRHFIRLGVDPCMMNHNNCRIIHTMKGYACQIVKGQKSAKSGLWKAVEKEDVELTTQLLKTWCRVNIRKNKSVKDVADETSNMNLVKALAKFEKTNEIVTAAFACEPGRVRELCRGGGYDTQQHDESYRVPRPLVVSVKELGAVATDTLTMLQGCGYQDCNYDDDLAVNMKAFETTEFYNNIDEGSDVSLMAALDLLASGSVNIYLVSHQPDTAGWTYLHYIVNRYAKIKEVNEERSRLLVRMIYRLALAGLDVNQRDVSGDTALIKAAQRLDQTLMSHLIRLGCDPSVKAVNGRTVNQEVYENKGQLVFHKKYRHEDLPGLWVAIESNDISKAERWLKSWSRVKTKKGDRRMLDIAHAMKRAEILRLLEDYEHANEFVCATFACDLNAMMHLLALGKGKHKVNTKDEFYHVGYTSDWHAEFMSRPIIICAMEMCDSRVVDFLLQFGAELSTVYEEDVPCGAIAFWAFRDRIDNANTFVVAKYADVTLRDELGCTLLHKIIKKKRPEGKLQIVKTLLERGIDVAARDSEGSTARDYIDIYNVCDGDVLRATIDANVLDLVLTDQHYRIETLLVDGYDHILDIRGNKKNMTARELAELKELKDTLALLEEFGNYKKEIDLLQKSAIKGDLSMISKLAGEKRCALSKDKAGRSLLHVAVLHEHPAICKFLIEQQPTLINCTDNVLRTPLHYCVCLKDRQKIWTILQDGGADPNLIDANNLSVYDYVRELETPSAIKDRPRGRRVRAYRPEEVIDYERAFPYGAKAEVSQLANKLIAAIPTATVGEIEAMTRGCKWPLREADKDKDVLKACIDHNKVDIVKHLVGDCGARPGVTLQVGGESLSAVDYATRNAKNAIASLLENAELTELKF